MATVPEIPVMQVPVRDSEEPADAFTSTVLAWAPVEVPRGQRPSSIVLAVLGTLAGVAAMALGAFAVISAGESSDADKAVATPPAVTSAPAAEARALALLAKPSTERIVFSGSGGRLVLAVGSGGRAAVLMRGLPRRPAAKPYYAWVVRPGASAPLRAARFVGTERAIFLSLPVRVETSVVVSTMRPAARQPGRSGFIAVRP
jgi:hypothetical protein